MAQKLAWTQNRQTKTQWVVALPSTDLRKIDLTAHLLFFFSLVALVQ